MGKRKERRLAAMIAASRRVKLDLFAEPSSGEMVDTSLHEVGGYPDQDHRAGVPLSPSSGKTQENPLSLLGQYSDDESDDEAIKQPKHVDERSSSPDIDAHVEKPADAGAEPGSKTAEDIAGHNDQHEPDQLETVKEPDGNDVKGSDIAAEVAVAGEVDLPPKICISESSVLQADGEMTGGWKMVLHEQSNQYYYWNTVTGETSWDTPSDLTVEAQVPGGQNTSSECGERVGSLLDMHAHSHVNSEAVAYAYVTAVDGIGCGNPISEHAADYGTVSGIGSESNEVAHFAYDAHQILTQYSTGIAGISYQSSSMLPEYGSSHQSQNTLPEQLATSLEEHHVAHEDMGTNLTERSEHDERTDVHSAQLLKYGESLLRRLKALDRSGPNFDGRQSIAREIEVRISDCKALSSYGSLLLPFWWHTETMLKQLESVISHEEASLVVQTESYNQIVEKPNQSSVTEESPVQGTGSGLELIEDKARLCSVENNNSSTANDISKGQIEDNSQIPDGEDVNTSRLSCGYSAQQLNNAVGKEVVLETHPITAPVHMVTNTKSDGEEDMDVDMDVEMEVDDESSGDHTSARDLSSSECPPSEQFIQPNLSSSACPTIPLEESVAPLPPDEEWIPPPPPDIELIPPPPPEEPLAPFPPPSYADTVSYHSYQGQCDLGYTVQNYEYYAPTTSGLTNGNYYAHNEGTYTTEPQRPPWYVPVVASSFPEVPVDTTPVEPVPYYEVSSATIPPVSVATNAAEPLPYYVVSSATIPSVAVASDTVETVPNYVVSSATIPPVPVVSNAVEPVPYYDVSSAIITPVPVATSTGSSEFYVECGPISYHSNVAASDQTTSVGFGMEHGSSSLPEVNFEPDISQPPSIASAAQTAGATLVNGSTADVHPLAAPKSQSKAMRSKKRNVAVVPGLRSNKKVSTLVDKWKAAKEELHGEEDEDEEPASAYEILEKKRQKEIEQWRTRQIATGEAKDNANFLPLGGDWRERVKRKKAKTGAVQASLDTVRDEKKQPDLAELSKDLPSGWQAYWDESTKVVYYGNTVTSETTWTRPTR